MDAVNPRKNLEALLRVFVRARSAADNLRLVIKQYRQELLGGLSGVISLGGQLSDGRWLPWHRRVGL